MKSIVLFAILAFASCYTFNYTEYSLGQAEQFGLSQAQIQASLPCYTALGNDFDTLGELIASENIVTIFSQISQVIAQIKTDFSTTCQAYFITLETMIEEHTNISNIEQTMKQNFELYYAQVIQQVATQINDLISGDDYEAGVAKAYYGQILLGIVTPQTLPVPQLNVSLYTPFNVEEFSNEYFTAFFNTIGSNQLVNGTQISACLSEIISFVESVESVAANFSTFSFAEKVSSISSFFTQTGETVEGCEYYAEIFSSVMGPLYSSFISNPASFIFQVANNFAMNAPEMIQSMQQEEIYILEGEYTQAGELKAERFNQVFGFVGF